MLKGSLVKTLTIHQPWAQLAALGIKTIETRSWPAPASLIGQRIAIHASAKRPTSDFIEGTDIYVTSYGRLDAPGLDLDLPLGVVVGSAVLTAYVPMYHIAQLIGGGWRTCTFPNVQINGDAATLVDGGAADPVDITDQLPFGIFEPGRWAWLLADAAPTTERCPWCWGDGGFDFRTYDRPDDLEMCPVCSGAGRCDPIPARGRQRVWEWTPA